MERLNQISNSLHRDIQNRENYISNINNQKIQHSNEQMRQQNNDYDKVPDYETLQNMYLQHLSSGPPDSTNQQNNNQPLEMNYSPNTQNSNNNTTNYINERPFSVAGLIFIYYEIIRKNNKKSIGRFFKMRGFSIFMLRKQKQKLESRGLDVINKRPISTNSLNSNSKFIIK